METHSPDIPHRSTTPETVLTTEQIKSLKETPRAASGSGSVLSTTEKNSTIETLLKAEMADNLSLDAPGFFEEIFLTKDISNDVVEQCYNHLVATDFYDETQACFPDIPRSGVEKAMYGPTRDTMNAIIEWRRNQRELPAIDSTTWYVATKGLIGATKGHQAVYPDLITHAKGESNIEGAPTGTSWRDVRLICEVKPQDGKDTDMNLHLQLAKYARKVFLYQEGRRRFVLGWTLCGSTVRGWLFDRSGGLSSQSFDFHEDPHMFIRMILAIASLKGADLGYDPTISLETIEGKLRNVISYDDGDPHSKYNGKYVVVRILMPRPSLCGRGTFVWEVYRIDDPNGPRFAIKDAWRDSKRKFSEGQIFQKIKEITRGEKLEGVVDCLSFCDLPSPHGAKRSLYDDIEMSVRRGVKGHLQGSFAKRRHCRLLMDEAGTPLGEFRSLKELFGVLIDGVKGRP